jgi:hypothetical protein
LSMLAEYASVNAKIDFPATWQDNKGDSGEDVLTPS